MLLTPLAVVIHRRESASGLNVKLNEEPVAGCAREGQDKIIAVGSTTDLENLRLMWAVQL